VVRSDAATGGALLWILLILLLLVYAFLIGLFAGPRAAES
jgi:hypothetical protein